ncbi:MAG: hypothetical protein M1831_004717 [Alyxoria varia]|nr:MAG: hypothetical protein M1831_004717 [Alyxoria varia]
MRSHGPRALGIEPGRLPCGSTYLYRVQYPGTRTRHTEGSLGGLSAAWTMGDLTRFLRRVDRNSDRDFDQAVTNALDWRSHERSPFVQVFTDYTHAVNWMCKWCKIHPGNDDKVYLLIIDARRVTNTVYWTRQVIIGRHVRGVRRSYNDQYLIEHDVPGHAIIEERCKGCTLSRYTEACVPGGICVHRYEDMFVSQIQDLSITRNEPRVHQSGLAQVNMSSPTRVQTHHSAGLALAHNNLPERQKTGNYQSGVARFNHTSAEGGIPRQFQSGIARPDSTPPERDEMHWVLERPRYYYF